MTKYKLCCTRCGNEWEVDRQTRRFPPADGYICPECVIASAPPEWRGLSLDQLHDVRRGIEARLRALDANAAEHAALIGDWLTLDGVISARGGADERTT